ncbi:MAG: amino acid ABC transporter ATP-binding protein [Sedimentibacter sp.]
MELKFKNLSKSYSELVLDDISVDIKGYDSVAIIGKSGCGKSTLLRLLSGIEEADKGFISVNNHIVSKDTLKEYHENIGIVFQQHNLFPHLTILKNITIILEKRLGLTKEKSIERASLLLKQLGLEEEINKKPRNISGGQAQRASIARALSTNPELIFLDEPTAALDPILTGEVLDSIQELKGLGTKFIFVTHEINFVKEFADYVIFIDEGKILEQGGVNILDNPQSDKLKYFIEKVL